MSHKNREKVKNFHVLSAEFSFEGFSCSLDVLYGGLRIGKLQFLIKKILHFFQLSFLKCFAKTPDPDQDPGCYSA